MAGLADRLSPRGLGDRIACSLALTIPYRDAALHHYLSLVEHQFRRDIGERSTVRLKKYFYSLRPALALRWLRHHDEGRLPMALPELMATTPVPSDVAAAIADLFARKRVTSELGEGPRIAILDDFIAAEMAWAQAAKKRDRIDRATIIAAADNLFRRIVTAA